MLFPRPDSLVSYQISYIPHHSCHGFDHGVDHHEAHARSFTKKKKENARGQPLAPPAPAHDPVHLSERSPCQRPPAQTLVFPPEIVDLMYIFSVNAV